MNLLLGGRLWKLLVFTGVVMVVLALFVGREVGHANLLEEPVPEWSSPKSMALRKIGDVAGSQSQPNLLSNLDCRLLTYRTVSDKTMRTGCFTETAFGLHDSDMGMAIYNGTDEALELLLMAITRF